MAQRGWRIDLDRCVGCSACVVACKSENKTSEEAVMAVDRAGRPKHMAYRWVVTQDTGFFPAVQRRFVSMACNHCANPACLNACPLSDSADPSNPDNVIVKRASDGVVLIDQERCNGCRYCISACPYGAPQFNDATSRVEKCTMCAHRTENGYEPACVQTCIGGALHYIEDFAATPGAGAPADFGNPGYTRPSIVFGRTE